MKQLVTKSTRGDKILDACLTNCSHLLRDSFCDHSFSVFFFYLGVKLQHSAVAGSRLLHTLPSLADNSPLCRRWQTTFSLLCKNWRSSMCSLRYDWSMISICTFQSSSKLFSVCLLYTSPSPRDGLLSRMPSSA